MRKTLKAIGAAWAAILLAILIVLAHTPWANAGTTATICHPAGGCTDGYSFSGGGDYYIGRNATQFNIDLMGHVGKRWPFDGHHLNQHYHGHDVVTIRQANAPQSDCWGNDPNHRADFVQIQQCTANDYYVLSGEWIVSVQVSDAAGFPEPVTSCRQRGCVLYNWSSGGSSNW